jgi:hypothetical protein
MDSKQPKERFVPPPSEFSRLASFTYTDDFGNSTEALITQDGDLRIQQASDNHTLMLKLSKKDAIRMITSILCEYSNETELQEFQENINNLKAAIQDKFI